MYIYEGHMGSLYTSDSVLDYEDTYCETCGDSDWLIGHANTREEAWNLLKDDTDIDGFAQAVINSSDTTFSAIDNVVTDLSVNGNQLANNLTV